jgi:hypothetical protein
VGVTLVLYRFVPSRRLPFRDALVGAAATGLMTAGIAVASSYVFDAVLEMSSIFGSITTVFVFLYSVYLHACALLLGAEIARVRGLPPAELEHVVPKEVHIRPAVAAELARAALGAHRRGAASLHQTQAPQSAQRPPEPPGTRRSGRTSRSTSRSCGRSPRAPRAPAPRRRGTRRPRWRRCRRA